MNQENSAADNNWQASKTCVIQRTTFLFNNERMSDVCFVVGEGTDAEQIISAHKFVLSIGSCVFNAMFYGRLATQSKKIKIPDIEPRAFFALMKFLYTDFTQIDKETVIPILYAARKYCVSTLASKCIQFLSHNLTPKNVISTLNDARVYDVPELELKCFGIIDYDARKVLSTEEFINSSLNIVCDIISRDSLLIKECDLFQAVLEWSRAECNRQRLAESSENQKVVLKHALKLIRFPLMTPIEFSTGAARSGLLTEAETISLFQCIIEGIRGSTDFSATPRSCYPHKTVANSCEESKPTTSQSSQTRLSPYRDGQKIIHLKHNVKGNQHHQKKF